MVTIFEITVTAFVLILSAGAVAKVVVQARRGRKEDDSIFSEGISVVSRDADGVVVWKAVSCGIAKLRLPEGTTVVTPIGGTNHRCDRAVVDEIIPAEGYGNRDVATSLHGDSGAFLTYDEGYIVRSNLDTDIMQECTEGIHFYENRSQARNHYDCYPPHY
jgi:hypothetical protein